MAWTFDEYFCMFVLSSPFFFLISIYFIIWLGGRSIKTYRKKNDKNKLIVGIIVVLILSLSIVSIGYLEYRFLSIRNEYQKYAIVIEQENNTPYEIILPNLVHHEKLDTFFHPDKYNILAGECDIEGIMNNTFIIIKSSSRVLNIEYEKQSDYLEYNKLNWDYPNELIELDEINNSQSIQIDFFSEINESCILKIEWVESYSSNVIGGQSNDIRIFGSLWNGINVVDVESRTLIAD